MNTEIETIVNYLETHFEKNLKSIICLPKNTKCADIDYVILPINKIDDIFVVVYCDYMISHCGNFWCTNNNCKNVNPTNLHERVLIRIMVEDGVYDDSFGEYSVELYKLEIDKIDKKYKNETLHNKLKILISKFIAEVDNLKLGLDCKLIIDVKEQVMNNVFARLCSNMKNIELNNGYSDLDNCVKCGIKTATRTTCKHYLCIRCTSYILNKFSDCYYNNTGNITSMPCCVVCNTSLMCVK